MMIEFGKTLRAAREAKGYTVSQVAEMTHLLSSVVDGLEREDFSHVPAPIYGRGFVRLYCEAVGLDSKPLVTAYMDIINGTHTQPVAPGPVAETAQPEFTAVEPAPTAAPAQDVSEPTTKAEPVLPEPILPEPPPAKAFRIPPLKGQPDLFNPEPEPSHSQPPASVASTAETETSPAHDQRQSLSRYSAPLPTKPPFRLPTISIPPRVWRLGALGFGGLVILILLALGFRALYRATTEPADTRPTAAEAIEQKTATQVKPEPSPVADKPTLPSTPREAQKIPPLYFD